LQEEQSSVLQIVLETGFGDLSEFTRRFRARFGRPPAKYDA
jgi:AraC family transcriptional regulator